MRKLFPPLWQFWLLLLLAGASTGQAQDLSRLPGNVYTASNSCFTTLRQHRAARPASGYNPNGYAVTP